jgi:hypothetical protein
VLLRGARSTATGRTVSLTIDDTDTSVLPWPDGAELICDQHQPDDTEIFRIEAHQDAGYLISGSEYGAFLLSNDGRQLQCWTAGHEDGIWQRLLIAQVLPFAALLHGLEIFHASAVVRNGEAVAVLGPSRAGKSSLALELCHLGASFLADDVIALESHADRLVAYPGTQIAGIDRDESHSSKEGGPEIIAVNARERLVGVPSASGPAPLAALFFLERRADGPANPHFEATADPQTLLTATFNFVLATPERLRGLLDVCALAARQRVERVVVGPQTNANELAKAVEKRLSSHL